ncbi:MAG: protein kinase [Acidobacteriota bacterium]
MNLAPGERLDHYEIIERIGVGGMGEVFRARDTRLPREVAIKVSTMAFNERFAREAKVIASLNHPNICTLFDVGPNYLVMELVEGATLQDIIKQSALGLEEASRIARQIADALDYAHEHGVIHRDLKPANIKVRPDGVVKVLDFGLAKAVQAIQADDMATVTLDGTQAGSILGTPNYMSPEQATGRPTDKRSDTWSFGIVFYEMLAGGKPFSGSTVQESIASTLRDAPDLSKVPPQVRRLLRRCLEKDPQNRLRHLGDVMSLIDEAPSVEMGVVATVAPEKTRTKWLWPAVAGIGLIAAAAIGALHFSERPAPRESVRFEITLPSGVTATRAGTFSISPDGRSIVFAATNAEGTRWWLRRMDSTEVRPLNLEPSGNPFAPFWSPDSKFIAYSNGKDIVKAEVAGGATQTICTGCQALGGSWGKDGNILLGNLSGITRVSEGGGTPVELTKADRSQGEAHVHPVLLPDGKHFLYLEVAGGKSGILAGSVDAKPEGQSKDMLLATPAGVVWVPPGNGVPGELLYLRDGNLMAQPFDPAKIAFAGDARPVANQVGVADNLAWGLFSASENGQLVYRNSAQASHQQLTWLDRTGKNLGTVGEPAQVSVVVLSPDGKRAALALNSSGTSTEDIWIEDLAAGPRTRLTFDPGPETQPIWSPDGLSVAYVGLRDSRWGIYRRASNGAAGEEQLYTVPAGTNAPNLSDWSPDGKLILFHRFGSGTDTDLWMLPVESVSAPKLLLQTPFQEIATRVSKDGRWYLYRSNESGRNEIYVQAVPGSGAPSGKWLVSKDGSAGMARWRRDGREIFYLANDGGVMSVDVNASASFQAAPPKKLFDVPLAFRALLASRNAGTAADVTPDGQRFLFAIPLADTSVAQYQVVTEWRSVQVR